MLPCGHAKLGKHLAPARHNALRLRKMRHAAFAGQHPPFKLYADRPP